MRNLMIGSAIALAACSAPKSNQTTESEATTTSADAAPSVASTPAASIPASARTVAVNVQGVAAVGATVRVKSMELGTDATVLDVSASYGGTTTNDVNLAGSPTYLLDDQGNKLMLKPPQDNPELRITKGQTMDGKLVFLGAVSPAAKSLKLVFNDNQPGDSIIDPGLTIALPLGGAKP